MQNQYYAMHINNYSHLCGYFRSSHPFEHLLGDKWQRVEHSEEKTQLLKCFYFAGPVLFANTYCHTYECPLDIVVNIPINEDGCDVNIQSLHLYVMPENVVLFSIDLAMRDIEESKAWTVLRTLRDVCFIDKVKQAEFIKVAIEPFCEIHSKAVGQAQPSEAGFTFLTENGNKLKIFHVTSVGDTADGIMDNKQFDRLLYSAGTLSELDTRSLNGSSMAYVSKVLRQGKVNVFNNWRALALLDTMSIVTIGTKEEDFFFSICQNDYFRILYLYALYRKVYLYSQNHRFRLNPEMADEIKEDFENFSIRYAFPSMSYNFLPNVLAEAMNKGLELERDEAMIQQVVLRAADIRDERNDKMMNNFLTFLTVMASLSAVWDISCMIDSLICYDHVFANREGGFRVVIPLIISLVLSISVLIYVRQRRKKK